MSNQVRDPREVSVEIPMYDLYITGGRQKDRILKTEEEWLLYERALIVRLDPATRTSRLCVEYETPVDARADATASVLFKGGTLQGDTLYVCTATEVLVYQVPDFKRVGYVSLPCFHDLHHVSLTAGGTLLLANTGLDMVVECTMEGEVVREWNVLGEDPWGRFSHQIDYRKVPTTKPHRSHPNFVFQTGQEVWVTRFEQRDAICLTHPNQRIEIGVQRPHDGVLHGDHIYFTTVDGHLVIVDRHTRRISEVVDLTRIGDNDGAPLGWCRGVCVIDEKKVWVGFTRIRKTRFLENINWIKHGFRRPEKATHIALYDISAKRCLNEIDVEDCGLNIVFGIFPAS